MMRMRASKALILHLLIFQPRSVKNSRLLQDTKITELLQIQIMITEKVWFKFIIGLVQLEKGLPYG